MAESYLGEPPVDPAALADFPVFTLLAGAVLHRVHREEHGAWFFSNDPNSRFTPRDVPGRGTCYLTQRPVAALLEGLRGERSRVVAEDDVRRRRLFTVELDRDLRLADLGHPNAGAWSVNAEIHTTRDLDKTQRWAAAFHAAGLDGVRYMCRSDPSVELVAYALFADAGPSPSGAWPDGEDAEISDALISEAGEYGFRVLPTP